MALRETQSDVEVLITGGETFKNTQSTQETYSTGGESFRNTQSAVEVYLVEPSGRKARSYFIG